MLHDLEIKNMDLFHHDDDEDSDDDLWETDDIDGLEDTGHEHDHDDEDFY